MQFTHPCPSCGSEDLARYVSQGINPNASGRDRTTKRRIDTGCMVSGYNYHCWECGGDFDSLDPEHESNAIFRELPDNV